MEEHGILENQDVVEWANRLFHQVAADAVVNQRHVQLPVSHYSTIDLRDAPRDTTLSLTRATGALSITGYGEHPSMVTIEATEHLDRISMGGKFRHLKILARGASRTIKLEGEGQTDILEVVDAPHGIETRYFSPPHLLVVRNSRFIVDGAIDLARLMIEGGVHLVGGFTQGQTGVVGATTLRHERQPLNLGTVSESGAVDGRPCQLTILSNQPVTTEFVSEKSTITLHSGSKLRILKPRKDLPPLDMSGVLFDGEGTLEVERPLYRPRFQGTLAVDVHAELWDAEGAIDLMATPKAIVAGAGSNPLILRAVREASEAEMEAVSVYALSIADLAPLEKAERLVPWVPKRGIAKQHEKKMTLGGSDATAVARRQAHFWQRLSRILESSHAPGNIQSEVRYAAMNARRVALPRGRERFLLSVYRLIGYGERVMWPLYWLLALSIVGAFMVVGPSSDLCCERLPDISRTVWKLFFSPLAFFRFVDVRSAQTPLEDFIVVTIRVIGILLVFFSLAAARRVTKAEN